MPEHTQILTDIFDNARETARTDINPSTRHMATWIAAIAKIMLEPEPARVNVQHIDLGTTDPDRFVAGLIETLERPTILRRQAIAREQARKGRMPIGHVEGSPSTFSDNVHDSAEGRLERMTTRLEYLDRMLATEQKAHKRTKSGADALERLCAKLVIANRDRVEDGETWRRASDRVAELEATCERMRLNYKHATERAVDAENKLETLRKMATPTDVQIARADRAEAGIERLQKHGATVEAMIKKWDAQIDAVTGAHREGETYADAAVRTIHELTALNLEQSRRITEARELTAKVDTQLQRLRVRFSAHQGMTLEALISETIAEAEAPCPDCKVMAAQLDERAEQVRVADGDRVPLAMDLQIANDTIAKLQPVVDAAKALKVAHRGVPPTNHIHEVIAVVSAIEVYERAENDIAF
jgi:uncharacterized glyoxalase superfamily protein PhnB